MDYISRQVLQRHGFQEQRNITHRLRKPIEAVENSQDAVPPQYVLTDALSWTSSTRGPLIAGGPIVLNSWRQQWGAAYAAVTISIARQCSPWILSRAQYVRSSLGCSPHALERVRYVCIGAQLSCVEASHGYSEDSLLERRWGWAPSKGRRVGAIQAAG
jgi:hypothetical protein